MNIRLTLSEIIALQKVLKNPGHHLTEDFRELFTYGLVEEFERGYRITEGGNVVLNKNTPYLCNGQNMTEPLGLTKPYKWRKR